MQAILSDLINNTSSEPNKAALIRKAFQVMDSESKISDVVDYIKREHNIDVGPAYVSTIKQQVARAMNTQTYEALRLARKLVKEVGSIAAAKKTLEALAEEQDRVAMTRNHYTTQLEEIDFRLGDIERPIDPKDKRELTREKQRIERLLNALEDF
jgi:hypothetical protein